MISTKALGELLSQNSDQRLCKRWCLLTPNGTLLAYSQPADAKEIRSLAAMTALSWQEYDAAFQPRSSGLNGTVKHDRSQRQLHTLTNESETSNMIVRRIQPQLLLMLEGGVPPRRRTFEPRITAEGPNGEPLSLPDPKLDNGATAGTSLSSRAESTIGTSSGVLGLQRKKLEAMAAAIAADFKQTGFRMPDDISSRLF